LWTLGAGVLKGKGKKGLKFVRWENTEQVNPDVPMPQRHTAVSAYACWLGPDFIERSLYLIGQLQVSLQQVPGELISKAEAESRIHETLDPEEDLQGRCKGGTGKEGGGRFYND
jgi:hypothetical protein